MRRGLSQNSLLIAWLQSSPYSPLALWSRQGHLTSGLIWRKSWHLFLIRSSGSPEMPRAVGTKGREKKQTELVFTVGQVKKPAGNHRTSACAPGAGQVENKTVHSNSKAGKPSCSQLSRAGLSWSKGQGPGCPVVGGSPVRCVSFSKHSHSARDPVGAQNSIWVRMKFVLCICVSVCGGEVVAASCVCVLALQPPSSKVVPKPTNICSGSPKMPRTGAPKEEQRSRRRWWHLLPATLI
jgi:hypothetical protein